jgi:hypothetical protein
MSQHALPRMPLRDASAQLNNPSTALRTGLEVSPLDPLPRMPLGDAPTKPRHMRIHLRHLLGVAEVEDGGASFGLAQDMLLEGHRQDLIRSRGWPLATPPLSLETCG